MTHKEARKLKRNQMVWVVDGPFEHNPLNHIIEDFGFVPGIHRAPVAQVFSSGNSTDVYVLNSHERTIYVKPAHIHLDPVFALKDFVKQTELAIQRCKDEIGYLDSERTRYEDKFQRKKK